MQFNDFPFGEEAWRSLFHRGIIQLLIRDGRDDLGRGGTLLSLRHACKATHRWFSARFDPDWQVAIPTTMFVAELAGQVAAP